MTVSRREFFGSLAAAGALRELPAQPAPQPAAGAPHLGSLYDFVQKQADRSRFELSYLRAAAPDLRQWQQRARAKVLELLFYAPDRVVPEARVAGRGDRGDYTEERLTFQTGPDSRIPAVVLIPKKATLPAPGIVVLHSHDGIYLWGKEKVLENDDEHPWLTAFKKRAYGERSIAAELARRGYVTIAIDMFYWSERRLILDDDPAAYRERPRTMTDAEIEAFNRRASQNESLVGRSCFAAGITWPGILIWDDLRTLDYLASRPEVDPKRMGCVGLSVGGYRSFMLAALDERIRAAVNVGWMTSLGSQIRQHVINSIGLSFHIVGLYRQLDLPELAAAVAPRALLVINGSQDRLFPLEGVRAAFDTIARCYQKAGAPDRQRCSLYDAPHRFDLEMQGEAWEWLGRWI